MGAATAEVSRQTLPSDISNRPIVVVLEGMQRSRLRWRLDGFVTSVLWVNRVVIVVREWARTTPFQIMLPAEAAAAAPAVKSRAAFVGTCAIPTPPSRQWLRLKPACAAW